jgi:hypothetical protein
MSRKSNTTIKTPEANRAEWLAMQANAERVVNDIQKDLEDLAAMNAKRDQLTTAVEQAINYMSGGPDIMTADRVTQHVVKSLRSSADDYVAIRRIANRQIAQRCRSSNQVAMQPAIFTMICLKNGRRVVISHAPDVKVTPATHAIGGELE